MRIEDRNKRYQLATFNNKIINKISANFTTVERTYRSDNWITFSIGGISIDSFRPINSSREWDDNNGREGRIQPVLKAKRDPLFGYKLKKRKMGTSWKDILEKILAYRSFLTSTHHYPGKRRLKVWKRYTAFHKSEK